MKMKYGEVTDKIIEFLDTALENFLANDALVLTNGKWNIHLDYDGNNPSEGIEDLKIFVIHKRELISKIITSERVPEIINSAREVAEYFLHRNFIVSIDARDNVLLSFWLRLRVFFANFYV
jgi:hypothetical protein